MLDTTKRLEGVNTTQQGIVQLILKLTLISKHSQLETKKMEYWIQTVTKAALKALRWTHV